jgi:hypothetical protein
MPIWPTSSFYNSFGFIEVKSKKSFIIMTIIANKIETSKNNPEKRNIHQLNTVKPPITRFFRTRFPFYALTILGTIS